MKIHRAGLLLIATAALWTSAPAAHADTQYGGTGLYKDTRPANPSISLLVRDNGTVVARVGIGYRCRNIADSSKVIRVRGKVNGLTFTAKGHSRVRGLGTIRVTLTGATASLNATGNARVRVPGCRAYTNTFVLRTESAPAGAPAVPGPGTLMQGLTSQSAGGQRLPLALRVASNGRVYAVWSATVKCGSVAVPMIDVTPSRAVRSDGTFGGSQTYTIRYRGFAERYRVSFSGQFLADGAKGTLRARLQYRDGKRRYPPCLSGLQTWTARAT